jgi:hypothetical protein
MPPCPTPGAVAIRLPVVARNFLRLTELAPFLFAISLPSFCAVTSICQNLPRVAPQSRLCREKAINVKYRWTLLSQESIIPPITFRGFDESRVR